MQPKWSGAKWLGNGVSGGTFTSGPFKFVLHTTETRGIPGYNSGRSAPHVTYYPKYRKFYQHSPFTQGARALRNEAGGTQTNRDSVIQLEIVCYSQKSVADRYASSGAIWVADLTDEHLDDIRGFMHWASGEFGIPWVWPERQAFSYAQANARGFRLTGDEFDNYGGFMAHQHVPENTHWDTGALDWATLMAQAPGGATMNPLRKGDKGNMVSLYRKAINAWHVRYGRTAPLPSGNEFDSAMEFQVKQYQKSANVGFIIVDDKKVYNGVIDGTLAFALGRYILPPGAAKDGIDGTDGEDGEDGKDGTVEVRVNGVIVS